MLRKIESITELDWKVSCLWLLFLEACWRQSWSDVVGRDVSLSVAFVKDIYKEVLIDNLRCSFCRSLLPDAVRSSDSLPLFLKPLAANHLSSTVLQEPVQILRATSATVALWAEGFYDCNASYPLLLLLSMTPQWWIYSFCCSYWSTGLYPTVPTWAVKPPTGTPQIKLVYWRLIEVHLMELSNQYAHRRPTRPCLFKLAHLERGRVMNNLIHIGRSVGLSHHNPNCQKIRRRCSPPFLNKVYRPHFVVPVHKLQELMSATFKFNPFAIYVRSVLLFAVVGNVMVIVVVLFSIQNPAKIQLLKGRTSCFNF